MDITFADVLGNDAFSLTSLTAYVNAQPYVPGKISKLGIFEVDSVTTTTVEIESYAGTLALIPNVPRGGPATQNKHNKRVIRKLTVPHLPLSDTVRADEIQNVRAFGSADPFQGVMSVMDLRLKEMLPKHDATLEYGRMGALKGIIYDADGSTVIYNLFNEFGVSQQSQDFTFGTTTTKRLPVITGVKGMIEDELGAASYEGIVALVDPVFFANLITSPDVLTAYQYQQGGGSGVLREDLRYDGVTYGGVTFIQYRGKVGGIPFLAPNTGIAFPIGAPNLYRTAFAPGDWMDTVNTPGQARYARLYPDQYGKSLLLETQSNPLSFCTRPRVLVNLYSST